MPRASKVRESVTNIEAQLVAELRKDTREQARIDRELEEHAERVRDYAKSISPVRHGDYAAAWHISKRVRVDAETGARIVRVSNTDFKARWIEYGTGDPLPTPEFAVARRTAAAFGGTVDG